MAGAEVDLDPFGAFYRPTGNGIATRYPNGGVVGGTRDPETRKLRVDTGVVMALTHAEAHRYRREYARAVREGALEQVDAAAYLAFVNANQAPAASPSKGGRRARKPEETDA